jgi:hypothetical protein
MHFCGIIECYVIVSFLSSVTTNLKGLDSVLFPIHRVLRLNSSSVMPYFFEGYETSFLDLVCGRFTVTEGYTGYIHRVLRYLSRVTCSNSPFIVGLY